MTKLIAIVLAFVYVISPLDFIPDTIPILGLIDDVLAVLIAIRTITVKYRRN